MKKAVFVVAPQMFRDEEYVEPKAVLEDAGVEVKTASTVVGEIYGKIKIKAQSDMLASEINPDDFDAIVFIGGPGSSVYFKDENIHKTAKKFYDLGKIVSAICIAPTILANAGILKGKNATVFPDGEAALIKGGANYTAKDLEVDGRIITADGPQSAKKFGQALVDMIKH